MIDTLNIPIPATWFYLYTYFQSFNWQLGDPEWKETLT